MEQVQRQQFQQELEEIDPTVSWEFFIDTIYDNSWFLSLLGVTLPVAQDFGKL